MAMDFSGRIGRVIDNPVEAQSAAMEEGHAWRVRHNPKFSVISVNNARSGPQRMSTDGTIYLCSNIHTELFFLSVDFSVFFELTKAVCLFIKLIWHVGKLVNMKSVRFNLMDLDCFKLTPQ